MAARAGSDDKGNAKTAVVTHTDMERSRIHSSTTAEGKRIITPMTKTRRFIFMACGLDENDLISYAARSFVL
jgi:hypothetical protein